MRLKSKKILVAASVIILVAICGVYLIKKKVYKTAPKKIYEVAVMARSQNSSDPQEDARTSLKSGDVLLAGEEGKRWSATESVSYIILKMNLTEDQAQKLISPEERGLSEDEIEKEMENFRGGREDIPAEEAEAYENELEQRREIVTLRQYRINLEKYFPDFKPNDLLSGQPFQDKVYGWEIVDKK